MMADILRTEEQEGQISFSIDGKYRFFEYSRKSRYFYRKYRVQSSFWLYGEIGGGYKTAAPARVGSALDVYWGVRSLSESSDAV